MPAELIGTVSFIQSETISKSPVMNLSKSHDLYDSLMERPIGPYNRMAATRGHLR